MKFGSLFCVVALLAVRVDCLHKLINIDYLGIGYDAIQGNPHSDLEDPGFKQSIFPLEYTKYQVTADGRFLIPDNTEAYQMMNCGYQTDSNEVHDERSYRKSLSVRISHHFFLSFFFSYYPRMTTLRSRVFAIANLSVVYLSVTLVHPT